MKKGKSKHGIFSYFGRYIWVAIFGGATLFICFNGIEDNWFHEDNQDRQLETTAVNKAQGLYNQESGPLDNYVRQRANGDLARDSPQIKQLKQTGNKFINNHTPTKVTNVSLDDTGNGTMTINGHQFLFQLADVAFAPHNSKFYQKNANVIKADIANEIQNGSFSVVRASNNTVYLYKGHSLVNGEFLAKGISYMPNITHQANAQHEQMIATEKHAKSDGTGIWGVPNAVGGNPSSQIYSISAENGHKISTVKGSSNSQQGQTITQKISGWLGNH